MLVVFMLGKVLVGRVVSNVCGVFMLGQEFLCQCFFRLVGVWWQYILIECFEILWCEVLCFMNYFVLLKCIFMFMECSFLFDVFMWVVYQYVLLLVLVYWQYGLNWLFLLNMICEVQWWQYICFLMVLSLLVGKFMLLFLYVFVMVLDLCILRKCMGMLR